MNQSYLQGKSSFSSFISVHLHKEASRYQEEQINMSEGSFTRKLADDDEVLNILDQHFDDRDTVDNVLNLEENKEALSAKKQKPDSQQRDNKALRLGCNIDPHNSKLPAIIVFQQDADAADMKGPAEQKSLDSADQIIGANINDFAEQKSSYMSIRINGDSILDGPLIRTGSVHNSSAVYQHPIEGLLAQPDAGRCNYRQKNVFTIGQSLDFNIGGNNNESGKQIIEGVRHEGVNMALQIDGDFFSKCSLICKGSGHSSSAGDSRLTEAVASQDVARRRNAHPNNMLSTDQALDVTEGGNKNGSGQQKIGGVIYGCENMAIKIHSDAFFNSPLICSGLCHRSPADYRLYKDANATQKHVKCDGGNVRVVIDGNVFISDSSSLGSLVGYMHQEEKIESQVDAKRYNIAQNNAIITNHSLDDIIGANINESGVQIIGGIEHEGVNINIQFNGNVFTDGPLILQGWGHDNTGLNINGSGQQKIEGDRHGVVNVLISIKGDVFVGPSSSVHEAGRYKIDDLLDATVGNNSNGSGDQNIKGIKYGGNNTAMEINGCAFFNAPLVSTCSRHSLPACNCRYTEVLGTLEHATSCTTHQKNVTPTGRSMDINSGHNTNISGHQEIEGVRFEVNNIMIEIDGDAYLNGPLYVY